MSDIAVVVATHRRSASLARLVAALETQDDAGRVEVVIVDDGSDDETPEVLARLAAPRAAWLRWCSTGRRRGPAAARNLGWRSTTAPIVAFTDDDCLPQPGWLRALRAAVEGGADLVQGRTLPEPTPGPRSSFSRTMEVIAPDGLFQTCNVAYRRDLLLRLRGFDERFRFPYGEDVDLAWRAIEAGAVTTFAPDAVVWHEVRNLGFADFLRELRRREGVALVLRLHPAGRRYLRHRLFFDASHPPALAALVGLTLAVTGRTYPTRLAAAALFLPWLHHRWRVHPRPGDRRQRLRDLPAGFVADVAEVAALAYGGARHRVLVL